MKAPALVWIGALVAVARVRRRGLLALLAAAAIGFLAGMTVSSGGASADEAAPAPNAVASAALPSYTPPSYTPPSYDSSPYYGSYGSGSYGSSSSGSGTTTTTAPGPVAASSIGESTYIVGKGDGELAPGTYVGKCTGSLSSWARYGSGGTDDLEGYDSIYTSGQLVVKVKSSDSSVKFTGSCSWSKR